jgi:hypothetical protein
MPVVLRSIMSLICSISPGFATPLPVDIGEAMACHRLHARLKAVDGIN